MMNKQTNGLFGLTAYCFFLEEKQMTPEEKLDSLGVMLPEVPKPLGSYVPFVRTGNIVYLSGILPLKGGKLTRTGKVGGSVIPEDAARDARTCAINALAILKSAVGSLNNVKRCVRISGYVASAPDFTGQPGVINGASDFMFEVLGEAGRHARSAVGVNVLPLDSPVEIEFIFEVGE
jgi:enamine deaminase RidA (YjgF/YER057c/UK114 family)